MESTYGFGLKPRPPPPFAHFQCLQGQRGQRLKLSVKVVKKATNLPYQSAYSTALVATLLTPMDFAADTLYLAMKSFNKDERAMIQILAHASKDEVEHIKVRWACHGPDTCACLQG
eukprot:1137478-Pelagomonas_calceolata.AAC.1